MSKLFNIQSSLPSRSDVSNATGKVQITRQSVQNSKIKISGRGNKDITSVINTIKQVVNKHLNKYESECSVISNEKELSDYIKAINDNGYFALDTETTGLDSIDDDIVGLSLYTENQKAVYIPINHKSYITHQKLDGQLSKEVILKHLKNIKASSIMHNAKFDLHFLFNKLGYDAKIYWDTMLFAKLMVNGLNESVALKNLYSRINGLKNDEALLSFDSYFGGISFEWVPIKYGYIYAAMDAKITYEVYKYQIGLVNRADAEGIDEIIENYNIFRNIEMPIIRVVKNMEDYGIKFDFEYANSLEMEYKEKLQAVEKQLDSIIISGWGTSIENYRKLNINNCKLSNPINYSSPTQIGILLYDIMGIDSKNGKKTGEEFLEKIDIPFTRLLLEYRGLSKLYNTYIEKMPEVVKSDGRVHCSFNILGAQTGRFSSDNPNMQNIPSYNKDIRKMFTASEGCYLFSCDYSGQEPRIAAHLSGDEVMIKAFSEGYDFYSFLGSNAYNLPYEECKEFYEDGTKNVNGKKIRDKSKKAYLGLTYGMQPATMADELKISVKEAQDVYKKVFKACPGLKRLLNDSIEIGKEYGYVTTIWGRKRYLEHIQKPKYEFKFNGEFGKTRFDPLDFDNENNEDDLNWELEEIKNFWTKKLKSAYGWKAVQAIIANAKKDGVEIIDNTFYIAEDERKAINSRVQGSAADMTKMGMIELEHNEELKQLGFRLLLTVHDEVIGEAPKEHKDRVVELMQECMLKPTLGLSVPFKCDVEVTERWYGEVIK